MAFLLLSGEAVGLSVAGSLPNQFLAKMLILFVSAFQADRIGMANTRQQQILSCKPGFHGVTFVPRAWEWEPSLRNQGGRAHPFHV